MNSLVSVEWLKENLSNPNLIILDASPTSNKSGLTPDYKDCQIPKTRKFDTENVFVDKSNSIPNMFRPTMVLREFIVPRKNIVLHSFPISELWN